MDVSQFPHPPPTSWAEMCPADPPSAGKPRSGKIRKGSKWLCSALTKSVHAAASSKGTYLASQFAASKADVVPKKPPWRSRTRSWGSPTTCWSVKCPMRSSAKIASTGNDPAYAKHLVRSCSGSVPR